MSQSITVALIGLNRLTASLGLALREYSQQPKADFVFTLRGQDGERAALTTAENMGALDDSIGNARTVVEDAHIVIVALPPGVIEDVYEYFAPKLKPGAVVLDLSTFKQPIVELAARVFPTDEAGQPSAHLVGIQPLVHNDFLFDTRMDVSAADAQLFLGSEMIIAPDVRATQEAVKLASDLAKILNMNPRYLMPSEYDAVADFTERLPALLGLTLFASMHTAPGRVDLMRAVNPNLAVMLHALRGAEPADIERMWTFQPQNTRQRLDELIAMLSHLREVLHDDPRADIDATLKAFRNWQTRRLKRDWDTYNESKSDAAQFGLLGALGNMFGGDRKPGDKR